MKLLVTGAWACNKEQLNTIEKMGHSVTFMQNESEQLPCSYDEIEGVIANGLFLTHPIEKFKSLKYIQLTSAGFDRVPIEYAQSKGIKLLNARGVYSIPMAEFAILGVLQLYKQSEYFSKNKLAKLWQKHRGLLELYGKTVCIVGCGNVGTECAKRFKAFGCEVLGVDLYPRLDDNYKAIYSLDKINNLLSNADVVILTLPLTEETKHLFDKELFNSFKNNSVLVNISRGAVVDENALLDALDNRLLGAVIDVFENEPLSELSPLWDRDNVILTPHNSFVSDGNAKRLEEVIFSNLKSFKE